jgi:uncharacterized SAM-binding protein YcdF (DUF218 family)
MSARRAGSVLLFVRLLMRVGVLALLALGVAFVLFVRSLAPAEGQDPAQADGLVVLTGGADRIEDALQLLNQGKGRRLLISGVNIHSTMEDFRRRSPGRERLFECCVDLDYQARNTYGNAVESARWVRRQGFRSVIVVTARYHLPRALLEFEHAMPEITVRGFAVIPEAARRHRWWEEPALVRLLVLEFIKYRGASVRLALGLSGG